MSICPARRARAISILGLGAALALAACGQKGPLYLPGHSKDTPWPLRSEAPAAGGAAPPAAPGSAPAPKADTPPAADPAAPAAPGAADGSSAAAPAAGHP